MMIRSFRPEISSISDIDSIRERRRVIIIYEHTGKKQFVKDQLAQEYDLYISNVSCTYGTGYVIPCGDVLHSYNSYRGIIKFPFLENGKINGNAIVSVYQSFFVNRYSINGNLKEPIKTSTALKGAIGKITDEYAKRNKKYVPLIPLPIYYNDEHQRLLAAEENKEFDFGDEISATPVYTLSQLIDDTSKVVQVKLEYEFPDSFDGIYPSEVEGDDPEWIIFETFSMIYDLVTRTMIRGALFIFDITDESFNVTNLKLLYNTLTKDDIKLDIQIFFEEVQERFNYFIESVGIINAASNNKISKVLYYVDDTVCKIKVVQQYSRENSLIKGNSRDRSKCDIEEDIISSSQY